MTERDPHSWDNGQNAPDWLTEWVRRMLELGSAAADRLDNPDDSSGKTEGNNAMTETQAGESTPALTAQDRCDRCGAQAKVLVCVPAADALCLMFCSHHAQRHAVALAQQGAVVLADDREKASRE